MQQNGKPEYKTGHDWVENVIHWELCNRLKFDWSEEESKPSRLEHCKD